MKPPPPPPPLSSSFPPFFLALLPGLPPLRLATGERGEGGNFLDGKKQGRFQSTRDFCVGGRQRRILPALLRVPHKSRGRKKLSYIYFLIILRVGAQPGGVCVCVCAKSPSGGSVPSD